jgi:AcrR family transcriptional regulator
MTVNGDMGHPPRRRQADRSAATRRALLDAARALFGQGGYAATGREEIVARAGVTRGALYHHFSDKEGLFRAVFEEMEAEIGERIVGAAMAGTDPLEELRLGAQAFLDAALDPAVRRIVLLDAPAVLGWEAWRQVDAEHGLGLVADGLGHAMDAGLLRRRPVQPLAHLLLAALNEAAMMVAAADEPESARASVGETVDDLLLWLRADG